MKDIIIGFVIQIISTVGVIVLFGLIMHLIRRGIYSLAGVVGYKLILIGGVIGTPVHELSHALMCIIFGHKITGIKLYTPNSSDGTLGYVMHTYNKKNLYHRIGNFFIGVAPVLAGSGVILLLMSFLLPITYNNVRQEIATIFNSSFIAPSIKDVFAFVLNTTKAVFSSELFTNWKGWLFLILAIAISTHTELSIADTKNSIGGFLFLALLLLIIDVALYTLFPGAFYTLCRSLTSFAFVLASILSLSIIFLFAVFLVILILKLIGIIFKR